MRRLLRLAEQLIDILGKDEVVALSTVFRTKGSTPRSTGARMAITRDGRVIGTVGGGCGEAEVIRASRDVLDDGRPRLVRVELTEDVTEEAEAACGGTMEVAVARWGRELVPILEVLLRAGRERKPVRLLTCTEPKTDMGAMAAQADFGSAFAGLGETETAALLAAVPPNEAVTPQFATQTVDKEKFTALIEDYPPAPLLLVCGGGHIAMPLCRMARELDYEVTVIDDRPSFANQARFPEGVKAICTPFDQALADFRLDTRTYAVVVTRGHRHDLECIRQLLGRGAGYVGMIGSRRRVAGFFDILRASGFTEDALAELHAPIGLDIGAETPAEIALAIMAEVTLVRGGGSGQPLGVAAEAHKINRNRTDN